jgi:hypothetical protein
VSSWPREEGRAASVPSIPCRDAVSDESDPGHNNVWPDLLLAGHSSPDTSHLGGTPDLGTWLLSTNAEQSWTAVPPRSSLTVCVRWGAEEMTVTVGVMYGASPN